MGYTPFQSALYQLKQVVELLKINPIIYERLQKPSRIINVAVPVTMDDGSSQVLNGYRVQYSNARGPYKGGIRLVGSIDWDEVTALAFWMSIKTAIADIPYGGAVGGVVIDGKSISSKEKENIVRSYTRRIAPNIGKRIDIPGPDLYMDSTSMAWMYDEYSKIIGENDLAIVTGKPVDLGGLKGRAGATAFGGLCVLESFLERMVLPKGSSIIVQGFGTVGAEFARLAYEAGYKIVGISDSTSALYAVDGINPNDALAYKQANNDSLKGFGGAQLEEITQDVLLTRTCDVLVPAALENVITEQNADSISAKVILELANNPTTPQADINLHSKKGVIVIPDVLANAGGVIASYFEWMQNIGERTWTEEQVRTELKNKLVTSTTEVWNMMKQFDTNPRSAAFIIGVDRLARAIELRGFSHD